MAEPTGVWALHVWRSPDGNEHPQWSGPDDPRLCRCGDRHTLACATAQLICPGVAHTEGVRPCVLCGLGWRVPTEELAVQLPTPSGLCLHEKQAGTPAPVPSCAYCAAGLEHYHIENHQQEDKCSPRQET